MSQRLSERCPTASLLWTASRILCDVHWRWNAEKGCYQTHQWTRDAFHKDLRDWPARTALSSLLRALREDERLADPMFRLLGLYITAEYMTALIAEGKL